MFAIRCQRPAACERPGRELNLRDTAPVATAALLHDVGKLALARVHPDYARTRTGGGPEDWTAAERAAYGIDHTTLAAVVAGCWNLPRRLARALERHHAPDAAGVAGVVRLADAVVHHGAGALLTIESLYEMGRRIGLDKGQVAAVVEAGSVPCCCRASA